MAFTLGGVAAPLLIRSILLHLCQVCETAPNARQYLTTRASFFFTRARTTGQARTGHGEGEPPVPRTGGLNQRQLARSVDRLNPSLHP